MIKRELVREVIVSLEDAALTAYMCVMDEMKDNRIIPEKSIPSLNILL